jgi:alkylated DNA repair dioxygenase AlkB
MPKSGVGFNSCLLYLYHHGHEFLAWHSNNERTILPNSTIASLSLGSERRFLFKHKTKIRIEHTQQKPAFEERKLSKQLVA